MYKKITLLFILVLVVLVSFGFVNTWAWNDKRTHKDLSEKAAEHSVLSLTSGNYLKSLGFSKNIEEPFILNGKSKSVKEWIGEGGIKEDAGNIFTAYYYNHFHNPLRIWSQAGLTTIYPSINGMSSLIWAQDTSTPNPWRWQKAREYYYIALTGKDFSGLEVASSKEKRDEYFAQTFKGLGHIIHLIEDAAQPAHVRDDPHPLDDIGIVPQFENWAYYNAEALGLYDLTPVFPTVSLNTSAEPGYIPITQFWDTNQFSDTNPVGGNAIGLAEYTSANFFSEDTIFSTSYPSWSNVVEYDKTIDDNTGEQRTYLRKLGAGEIISDKVGYGDPIQHLATARWFYRYLPTEYKHLGLELDDNVYQDYASLLLPRAVGYSAGLLNYFFRGKFKITNASYTSTSVTMQIRNKTYTNPADPLNSAIEPMGPGSLWVSYSYKDSQGNTIYGLSGAVDVDNVPSDCSTYLSITFPLNSYISSDATDVSFILIYRGVLGNESDAIAAKKLGYIGSTRIAYYHQPGGFGSGNNSSYIYSIDPDGQNIAQITNDSDGYEGDFSSKLSPDGTKLAFSAQNYLTGARDIIIVDLTSINAYPGNIIRILDSTPSGSSSIYNESSPSWSPDGKEIAAYMWQGSSTDTEIIIFNLATGQWRQITSAAIAEWIQKISWSPTGSKIVYSAQTSESGSSRYDIFIINTDGSSRINLTNDAYSDTSPSWSPDGTQILFSSTKDGGSIYDLWVMNADGKNPRQITDYTQSIYSSGWSPDGEQIVFSIGTWYSDLYIIDSNGTCPYPLTSDNYYSYTALNGSPSWAVK